MVPKGPINNIPTLVQIMAWRQPGDKPLSEPMMASLLTHIGLYASLGLNELTLIPAWISNYIHVSWDEITCLFLIFKGVAVKVWEWMSNFIPQFIGHVVSYPCWD